MQKLEALRSAQIALSHHQFQGERKRELSPSQVRHLKLAWTPLRRNFTRRKRTRNTKNSNPNTRTKRRIKRTRNHHLYLTHHQKAEEERKVLE